MCKVQSACMHVLCTHKVFYQACARTHPSPTPIAFMANISLIIMTHLSKTNDGSSCSSSDSSYMTRSRSPVRMLPTSTEPKAWFLRASRSFMPGNRTLDEHRQTLNIKHPPLSLSLSVSRSLSFSLTLFLSHSLSLSPSLSFSNYQIIYATIISPICLSLSLSLCLL